VNLTWDTFEQADTILKEGLDPVTLVCDVDTTNVGNLKELLISIQHLTHRYYKKTVREKPVTVEFNLDSKLTKADLESALAYMRKMEQGKNNNVLGFSRAEVLALEKHNRSASVMRKVRFIDPRDYDFTVYYAKQDAHDDGILPGVIRKYRNDLNLDVEFISINLLKDSQIANEPWFIEFDMRSQGIEKSCEVGAGFWKEVPQEVKDHLNGGRGFLLMNLYLEGFTDYFFDAFYAYAKENPDIPLDRIIYLTSALNVQECYDDWCERNNVDAKIQCWNSAAWEYSIVHYVYRGANKPLPREKKFLFLNRRLRRHRVLFPCLFAEAGLFEQGLVSYFPDDDIGYTLEDMNARLLVELAGDPVLLEKYNRGYALTRPNVPYIVDTSDNYFNHAVTMAEDLYERTYFSVVSETFYFNDDTTNAVFPSEKTFKPMYQLHPFIMVSRPHFLKELKKLGFRTFDQWFDESYDDIEDDVSRAAAINREVIRLTNLTDEQWVKMIEEMQEVLKHNQDRLRNRVKESFTKTDLRQLYDYAIDPFYVLNRDKAFLSNVNEVNDAFGPVFGFDAYNDSTIRDESVRPFSSSKWLTTLFRFDNVRYTYARVQDLEEYMYPWYYLLEINSGKDIYEQSLWKRVPEKTQEHITSGHGHLLLANIHEGETTWTFDAIHLMLEKNKTLPAEKVILVSGAANIQQLYDKYAELHQIKERIYVCHANLFHSRTREVWKGIVPFQNKELHAGTILTPYLEKAPRKKKFVCLNRVPKPHRVALMAMLEDRRLLHKGIVSCHVGNGGEQLSWVQSTLQHYFADGLFSREGAVRLREKLPIIVDRDDPETFVTYEFAEQIYFDTYFTVVTESFFFPRNTGNNIPTDCAIFPTEKIYKPIILGHPFIVVAPPGFLKHIQDQGFYTFPEMFDESYDSIEDDALRLRHIVNEIERVSSLSDSELTKLTIKLRPKLSRNQHRITRENEPRDLLRLLSQIANEKT